MATDTEQTAKTRLYGSDQPTPVQRLAFRGGDVPVAVYGLGKMGLPLAAVYADVAGSVVGVDVDSDVVEAVNAGESPVEGEPGLDALVEERVADGSLRATTDGEAAASEAALHVAIVPTLIADDGGADLSLIDAVVDTVADGLSPRDVVVVESTVPPGTCEERVRPRLAEASGLDPDEFGVAFCPERTASGRALRDIGGAYPKIVGGVDEESARVAELVYDELTDNDVIRVSSATTAEAVKVFEGVYRDVNIALANELATYARDLDVSVVEAIDAANTQPYSDIHTPGIGVGGHCIPYYPRFLVDAVDAPSPLLTTAREVNESMPGFAVDSVVEGLAETGVPLAQARVLVLGLTYRPGVAEIRETPALPVIEQLSLRGAHVEAVDPVLDTYEDFESAGATIRDLDALGETYDAVVLATAQSAFDDLDVASLAPGERDLVVVDGRQALADLRDADGVRYRGIGIDA